MRSRIFLISLYVFAQASIATAQSSVENSVDNDMKSLFGNNFIASPEMAKMVRSIVYPVNYSTGLVDITIPLYEIKCADISLPIALKYHGAGVKLGDNSGSMGQGWSLSCEPMISKKTRGKDDQASHYRCKVDQDNNDAWHFYYIATRTIDSQPDDYFLSIPGYQGEFVYVMDSKDSGKEFMSLPYQNLRIDQVSGDNWEIVDERGRKYKFDGIREFYENECTGWKATSIISSNKRDSITFSYKDNMEHPNAYRDYMVVIDGFSDRKGIEINREAFESSEVDNKNLMCPLRDYWMQDPVVYSFVYDHTILGCYRQTYQSDKDGYLHKDSKEAFFYSAENGPLMEKKIQKIVFPGGSVLFTYAHPGRSSMETLSRMDVYSNNKLVRTISFDMEYVAGQDRSYLNGISISGKDGKDHENYEFDYYEKYRLPRVGNKSIDFWGYYNGANRKDTATLVPCQTITTTRTSIVGTNPSDHTIYYTVNPDFKLHIGDPLPREANEEYMKFGALRSITYPAGSMDVFDYESHRYKDSHRNDSVRIAGGLRIKSIMSYENGKVRQTRSFVYGLDEKGCGFSPMSSDLEHFLYEQNKQYIEPVVVEYTSSNPKGSAECSTNEVISARHRTYLCSPILPNTYSNGSSVMYDYVTEYNGTPTNNSGKTVYHYDIDTDTLIAPIKSTAQNNRKLYWLYGQLLDKSVYKNTGGGYQLIEHLENYYDTQIPHFGVSTSLDVTLNNVIEGDWHIRPDLVYDTSPSLTNVDVGAKALKEKVESKYDDLGRWVTKTTSYGYRGAPSFWVNDVVTEDYPDGNSIVTTHRFPVDYSEDPYQKMYGDNIFSAVSSDMSNGDKFISISTPYQEIADGVYVPKSKNYKCSNDSEYRRRIAYRHDVYGNKIEEVKDGKEHVVYLYDYNHQYVVAKIENATYDEVSSLLGESSIRNMADSENLSGWEEKLDALRSLLPESQIYTYTYDPLVGVTSIKEPNGNLVHFEYDELGRLVRTYQVANDRTEVLSRYQYHYKTEK